MRNSCIRDTEWKGGREGGRASISSKFKAVLVNPGQVVTKGIALKPNQGSGFDVSGSKEWKGVNVIYPIEFNYLSVYSVCHKYSTNNG